MLRPCLFQRRVRKLTALALAYMLALAALAGPTTPARAGSAEDPSNVAVTAVANAFRQTNLVSDLPGVAFVEDPLLVNPWGISLNSTSPFWVANTFTSTSTLYRGDVGGSPLVRNPGLGFITIPGTPVGLPTGTVANTTNDFVVTSGSASGPARFIFATLTGNIVGWNPNVPAAGSTAGVIAVNVPNAVFTGLAIGNNNSQNLLYAANPAQGKIQVFNSTYTPINLSGSFTDPSLPADYAPFNIEALGGKLYVAYAKFDPQTGLDIEGLGNGIVSTFDFNGNFLQRLVTGGRLNSPWGFAIAPANFGAFGGALLVGNFGRGGASINAYDPTSGAHLGSMVNEAGQPIEIQELWDITFGNGGNGGDPNTLYFAAGIDDERHGLFGSLKPVATASTSLVQFTASNYAVAENAGSILINVTRTGDLSTGATVNYATFDGTAQQRGDYQIALGQLRFNPNEASKTFRILLVDDSFVEQTPETVNLVLSNPVGAGLGSPNTATLSIISNDPVTVNPLPNPIDNAQFFVRQHYLDFLNREPDAPGITFWTNQIISCGANAACVEQRRIAVSGAFFLSIEFQRTGFLVYLTHKAAFGALPRYGQFMRDTQAISRDVVIGQAGADALIESNTQAFFDDFVTRPEFVARYAGRTNQQYVDDLLQSIGLAGSSANLFLGRLEGAQEVPPRTTPSTGLGIVRLLPGNTRISASVSFSPLTTPQTDAHIHGPAAPGTNAGVLVPLPLGQFRDFRADINATVLGHLNNGLTYINIHSQQFPGGEIRGQLNAAAPIRDVLNNALNSGLLTRAQVLRIIAETEEFRIAERNSAFVLMQYFGYLRRNPNDPPDNSLAGYNFWLAKLNSFNGDHLAAEMVKAFITSGEYRSRFGNP